MKREEVEALVLNLRERVERLEDTPGLSARSNSIYYTDNYPIGTVLKFHLGLQSHVAVKVDGDHWRTTYVYSQTITLGTILRELAEAGSMYYDVLDRYTVRKFVP